MRSCVEGDYMEEREEVRDLRGRSELPPPPLFSEGFLFPWPEKDRLFLDEPPPWLAISNDPISSFNFWIYIRQSIIIKLDADFDFFQKQEKNKKYSKHHPQ